MFWNCIFEMASTLDANRQCVGQVFDLTMRYLSGKELDCLFLAGVEKSLEAAKEDEQATAMLDDWLTGLCLHQLGLFTVWGLKGRWRQAYICWSNAAAKLAKMTGGDLPAVNMDDMMAEWELLGCGTHKKSIHAILTLAATYPQLKQLRATIQSEARWVTSLRYPVFGVAQHTIEASFGLFTLLIFVVSLILLYRMMITYPILSLTSDVSRDSLKALRLISYEGSALFQNGLQIFGSRILYWIHLGLWVLVLERVPGWWIRRVLRH